MKKRIKAFTLAEILITLGIIGVVAAITIPQLLTNFKKRETVSKVKAAYSIFSQAVQLSIQENDEPSGWDVSDVSTVAEKYLTPYMTGVSRILGDEWLDHDYYRMRTLSSQGNPETNSYLDWSWNWKTVPLYKLQNGMIFVYSNSNDGHKMITVDINGFAPPNIMGIDGFSFWIDDKTSTVVPAGVTLSKAALINPKGHERACVRSQYWQYYNGGYCAALMQKDGWSISKDYPWGNGHLTKKEK